MENGLASKGFDVELGFYSRVVRSIGDLHQGLYPCVTVSE